MSSVPDLRAALKTLLITAAAPLTYDVQVVRGSPVSVTTLGPYVVLIGRAQGVRAAGSQNRIATTTRNIPFTTSQDEYTVELVIAVSLPGPGEPVAAEETADEIYTTLRDAIEGAAVNLGVAGIYEALPTGEFSFESVADSNGRYCTVLWGLYVTARD